MYRKLVFSLCLVLFSVAVAMAQDKGAKAADGTKVANGTRGADEVNGARGATGSAGSNGASGVNGTDAAAVAEGAGDSDAKTLRGMSVLGNDEAPMSLFIVPWKSSELGVETNLSRTLNEHDVPVDRDVFKRELDFYQVSVGSKTSAPAAGSKTLN
jgi:hypothetical protein